MSRGTAHRGARKTPEERSAEILRAARDLALEEGLAALTLRAVAARVGVASGLVSHYHPSIDALVARVFTEIVAAEIAEVAGLINVESTPADRLAALIRTLVDGGRDPVTVVWVESWTLSRRNHLLAESVRSQMDAWNAVVLDLISAGIDAGEFATDDPDAVAWLVLGLVDGVNAQALVRWGGAVDRGTRIGDVVAGLLRLSPEAFGGPRCH